MEEKQERQEHIPIWEYSKLLKTFDKVIDNRIKMSDNSKILFFIIFSLYTLLLLVLPNYLDSINYSIFVVTVNTVFIYNQVKSDDKILQLKEILFEIVMENDTKLSNSLYEETRKTNSEEDQ